VIKLLNFSVSSLMFIVPLLSSATRVLTVDVSFQRFSYLLYCTALQLSIEQLRCREYPLFFGCLAEYNLAPLPKTVASSGDTVFLVTASRSRTSCPSSPTSSLSTTSSPPLWTRCKSTANTLQISRLVYMIILENCEAISGF
jgi:hypothetical protein